MAIYDIHGNPITVASNVFYTETDITVNLINAPVGEISSSNPEGFVNNTRDYRVIDYFSFTGDYISIIQNLSGNYMGTRIAFYDSNKTFKSAISYTASVGQLTNDDYRIRIYSVPSGTGFIRIQIYLQNIEYYRYVPFKVQSFSDLEDVEFKDGYEFNIRELLGIPNVDSPFRGKSVICLGDSITENNSHNNNKSWCEYLKDVFGMYVYNNGKSGTGLIKGYQSYRSICNRVDLGVNDYPTITPDMVLIMANGNDATGGAYYDYNGNSVTVTNEYGAHSLPVGTTADTASTISVYGATRHLLEALITKYPTAQIGFITSTPRLQDLTSYWGAEKANFYGHGAFHDYVEAIKWVCDEYNVPCLDLYHNTVLRPWNTTNASTFYADSQIHPNTLGTIEGMLRPIVRWIMDNFN